MKNITALFIILIASVTLVFAIYAAFVWKEAYAIIVLIVITIGMFLGTLDLILSLYFPNSKIKKFIEWLKELFFNPF